MIYIGTREYKYGRMLMSHMVSENLEELHAFAFKMGINKKHFQNKKDKPHYDICKSKKIKALQMSNTQEVSDKQIVLVSKQLFQTMNENTPNNEIENPLAKARNEIIDYIENDAEIAIPAERFFNDDGTHITKKKYGHILLEILCQELREKFK